MSNFVSFETALKLKDAGFPQPEPALNQLWESTTRFGGFINGMSDFIHFADEDEKYPAKDWLKVNFPYIFLPTATDILQEIDDPYLSLAFEKGRWAVVELETEALWFNRQFEHENPAEACAAAWLAIKAKQ